MDRAVNFSRGDIRLPQFQVETWMGFIFINMDPAAAPLSSRLAALSEEVAHHDLASARGPKPDQYSKLPWNWKVMFENTNDGYHANRLHKGPIHDVCPSALSHFPALPEDTAGYFRINGLTHMDAGFNPTLKAIMPVFPQLTEAERSRVVFANIPPSLWVSFRPDQSSYFIIRAEGPEETSVEQGVLFAPGAMDEPLFSERLAMAAQSGAVFLAQDRHVDTQVQRGMRSRFAARGRYSWQEQTLLEFNQWLVKRYHAQRSRMGSTAH
jgi:phenylpropionate dioxygenase-like ring-hydroxylating dioxygenase large terminal subunit